MDMEIFISIVGAAVVLILIAWRFSGGRFGGLRPSEEAAGAFETFRIDPQREYYLSGSDLYPNAIIAIDKSRTLETDLWKKRDLTAEGMKGLVGNMRSKAMERLTFPRGFDIVDERGEKIGEWFSLPGVSIVVRTKGKGRVSISTPPIDLYSGP